ncbi:MAG: exosome complex protein Rrp42 [Nanoarchaeota archaeon]|nr:exosome complex protein Rrp42 [Nanoarchaeota archaeon]
MSDIFTTPKINAERIKRYLAEGKRLDGRSAEQFRDIEIEIGNVSKNAEGSARVKIGKTEVIAGIKLVPGEPYPDSLDKGNLMVTLEMLPMSSPRIELGPPKIDSIEMGRVIDRCIRESKFIELEKLCIIEGEKVWTVFIDIYTINDDGNMFDAAGIAAIAAIKNAKMPKLDEENKIVYGESTGKPMPTTKDVPISLTAYKIGDEIIFDPLKEEEDITEARVTIGMREGIISSMQKGDSAGLSVDEMNKIFKLMKTKSKEIALKIEKAVK